MIINLCFYVQIDNDEWVAPRIEGSETYENLGLHEPTKSNLLKLERFVNQGETDSISVSIWSPKERPGTSAIIKFNVEPTQIEEAIVSFIGEADRLKIPTNAIEIVVSACEREPYHKGDILTLESPLMNNPRYDHLSIPINASFTRLRSMTQVENWNFTDGGNLRLLLKKS